MSDKQIQQNLSDLNREIAGLVKHCPFEAAAQSLPEGCVINVGVEYGAAWVELRGADDRIIAEGPEDETVSECVERLTKLAISVDEDGPDMDVDMEAGR